MLKYDELKEKPREFPAATSLTNKEFQCLLPNFDTWVRHIFIFVVAFLLLYSRRPDAFLNPQFWAEDGTVWYADAYNLGWFYSLFLQQAGYFQTVSRLTASLSQVLQLSLAPLFFNVVAVSFKILPVNFLLSSRFAMLIPSTLTRFALCFLYLGLPNSAEVHVNLTNVQWHLAFLTCLILIARPSSQFSWRLFDVLIVTLSALSGPFSILLAPVAVVCWLSRRQQWLFNLSIFISVGAIIQTISLLLTFSARPQAQSGASLVNFAKLFGGQVVICSLLGQRIYAKILAFNLWSDVFVVVLAILGVGIIVYSLFVAPLELKLFNLFGWLIFCAALITPTVNEPIPQWEAMSLPGNATRYWFVPMMCFEVTLLYLLKRIYESNKFLIKFMAISLLPIILTGIVSDWRHNPYQDLKFQDFEKKFNESASGTQITIPLNPNGWTMTLRK